MDRRRLPANDRVVRRDLSAAFPGRMPVDGTPATVTVPVADLCRAPDGPRDSQVVLGDDLTVLEERAGWSFVVVGHDGYVGYVQSRAIGGAIDPNFFVSSRATHLYTSPDFKSREVASVSFGSRLRIVSGADRFLETAEGTFVPKAHLRGLAKPFSDPVTVAQLFFGTPYLWGGNSGFGLDCSALVQIACRACGISAPRDSDMQEDELGTPLDPDAPPQRGDLFFWKGHVAIAVDGATLIHANAHHMAVAYEPIDAAIARIEAQGDGPVTSRRRLQDFGVSS